MTHRVPAVLLLLTFGPVLMAASTPFSTEIKWTGLALGGGNLWSAVANWDPNLTPSLTKDLVFDATAATDTSIDDMVDDLLIGTISINGHYWNGILCSTSTKQVDPTWVFFDSPSTCNLGLNLAGTCGITKANTGTLALQGHNSFTGSVLVSHGLLAVNSNTGLGAEPFTTPGAGGTMVMDGGAIAFIPTVPMSIGEPLILSGAGDGSMPTLSGNGAYISTLGSLTGPINLQTSDIDIDVTPGAVMALTGVMSGPGGYRKSGAGTLQLLGSAVNTSTGNVLAGEGTLVAGRVGGRSFAGTVTIGASMGSTAVLRCDAPGQFGTSANAGTVFISNSATLQIAAGVDETVGSLQFNGHVTLVDAGSALRVIPLAGVSDSYAGVITGPGSVIKEGAGIQAFTGANTYTGPTGVADGTLIITGAQPSSGVFTMIPGTVEVSHGGSVGLVLIASGTTFRLGDGGGASKSMTLVGDLDVRFDGVAPSDHGSLSVVGTVTLDSASTISGTTGPTFSPAAGTTFTLIANDGTDPVSGHVGGLAEGDQARIGDWIFTISYVGGDGNDVTLTALHPAPVPAGSSKAWYRLNPIQAGKRCGLGSGAAVLLFPALLLAWRRGRRLDRK